ncbi:4Fe-4S binding protein, partial [Klebsiella pneumoniae]|uniref:4Fe-4S binding protein n=1 Tax=Klebsiella pneumoniae TaxID=573 RepID=UPI0013D815D8
FYFFFIEIWPQEIYYFTGLLVLAALALFLMNAIAGRLWCGYLCPQTVWTDLFMTVERRIEGDRRERMMRDAQPMTAERLARKALK